MSDNAGAAFAAALVAKDATTLIGLLADKIDFRALTPSRYWSATSPDQVVNEIILRQWFDSDDHIQRLVCSSTDRVADCEHIAYRLLVRNADGDFMVEQQAYYTTTENGTIGWMRVLCSGYRRHSDKAPDEPDPPQQCQLLDASA